MGVAAHKFGLLGNTEQSGRRRWVSDRGIFVDRGMPGSGLGWRKPGL